MDKQEKSLLIARAAQEPEDRLLLARVLDKQEQMERRNIPVSTGFLSPREQLLAAGLLTVFFPGRLKRREPGEKRCAK